MNSQATMKALLRRVKSLEAIAPAIDEEPQTITVDCIDPDGSVGDSYVITIPPPKWTRARNNARSLGRTSRL